MRVIIFDTETTGLPSTKIINPDTLHKWPHIVQFSYIIYNVTSTKMIKTSDNIIKIPNDIIISDFCTNLHGLTTDKCNSHGTNIKDVLSEFFKDMKTVDKIVGHNVSFDLNMVKVELLRLINNPDIDYDTKTLHIECFYTMCYTTKVYCTMKNSIDLCNIEIISKDGRKYNKFPKLFELYQKLFNETPNNLHNSLIDILVTLRCYHKLYYNIDLIDLDDDFKNIIIEKT